jgi:peptide/nickel transport system permease protein
MTRYVAGRLASSVVLFFAVTLFVFIAFFALPKDTGRRALSTPNQYKLHGSMMGEYGHYLWRLVRHADMGSSYGTREEVTKRLFRAAPVTLSLVAGGLVVWFLLAIPLGLIAAMRPRSLVDRFATVLILVGLCAHPVWLGLVLSYVFGHTLHVLPAQGYCSIVGLSTGCDGLSHWTSHLLLPWITFGLVNAALFSAMVRALVIEEMSEEYVRTAVAKGAAAGRVMHRHVLRNVALPLVTMIGIQAGTSLAGVIFIETAFDLPGLGAMLRRAAQQRDLPLTAGSVIFLAGAILVINLVVDLSYAWLDPRTRRSAHELRHA